MLMLWWLAHCANVCVLTTPLFTQARGLLHQFRSKAVIPCTLVGLCSQCDPGMWDSGHVPTIECITHLHNKPCPASLGVGDLWRLLLMLPAFIRTISGTCERSFSCCQRSYGRSKTVYLTCGSSASASAVLGCGLVICERSREYELFHERFTSHGKLLSLLICNFHSWLGVENQTLTNLASHNEDKQHVL